MSLEWLIFIILAVLSSGSALAVVLDQNVVRMAFWLMLSLAGVAGLFFLQHADFLGAAQLLIYVGGTVVLLVFGVMLTASGPFVRIQVSLAEILAGIGLGITLFLVLTFTLVSVPWDDLIASQPSSVVEAAQIGHATQMSRGTSRPLGLALLGLRAENALPGHPQSPGYFLPFEIVSVHLLVVLVGAAYLSRAKRRAM